MNPAPIPEQISRIVLIGFMGAGKSTVGAILSASLGWQFLDADTVLEERVGSTISDIFKSRGEAAFRDLEAHVISDLLREDRLILALGGGAVETETTRKILFDRPRTCVVFLEAPLEIMITRCEQQPGAAIRPILNDRQRLLTRFESRLPHYRFAHLTVQTEALTPQATVESILATLNPLLKENTPA